MSEQRREAREVVVMAANGLRYALLTIDRGYESGDEEIEVEWLDAGTDAEAVAKVADLTDIRSGAARLFVVAHEIESNSQTVADELTRRSEAAWARRVAQLKEQALASEAEERAEYERLRAKFGG